MSTNEMMKWSEIYCLWQSEVRKFSNLLNQTKCLRVAITKPQYGPLYYYNWVPNGTVDTSIQEDIKVLASAWPEIGTSWSKGTIRTAALLADCKTEEDTAAVWLCAFALTLLRSGSKWDETKRNAAKIEQEARTVFASEHEYWHTSSRAFFPQFYLPDGLFWDADNLSISTLIELAVVNASLVAAHYTPVEYFQKRP